MQTGIIIVTGKKKKELLPASGMIFNQVSLDTFPN